MRVARRTVNRRGLLLVAAAVAAVLAVEAGASAQSLRAPAPEPAPSGAYGTVTLAPHPCPFWGCEGMPLDATVVAKRDGRIVAKAAAKRGRYVLGLRPGRYTLTARPWGEWFAPLECDRVPVFVPAGRYVRADIRCRNADLDRRG